MPRARGPLYARDVALFTLLLPLARAFLGEDQRPEARRTTLHQEPRSPQARNEPCTASDRGFAEQLTYRSIWTFVPGRFCGPCPTCAVQPTPSGQALYDNDECRRPSREEGASGVHAKRSARERVPGRPGYCHYRALPRLRPDIARNAAVRLMFHAGFQVHTIAQSHQCRPVVLKHV